VLFTQLRCSGDRRLDHDHDPVGPPPLRAIVLSAAAHQAVVLVHDGGITREEGGLRHAVGCSVGRRRAWPRYASTSCGRSENRQVDLTLIGLLDDIRTAVRRV